jgi:hypothetical protein
MAGEPRPTGIVVAPAGALAVAATTAPFSPLLHLVLKSTCTAASTACSTAGQNLSAFSRSAFDQGVGVPWLLLDPPPSAVGHADRGRYLRPVGVVGVGHHVAGPPGDHRGRPFGLPVGFLGMDASAASPHEKRRGSRCGIRRSGISLAPPEPSLALLAPSPLLPKQLLWPISPASARRLACAWEPPRSAPGVGCPTSGACDALDGVQEVEGYPRPTGV